ncbi:hypothetical protein [Reinekea marinisedimentorum]|uniref:Uncharacterized protein n=1 Tax=Reinekea marinisedimentorum TaxID=230495 RepID=A0A4V2UJ07_9GAMM|nr:hypothetical protein [Reinekea marinisedimentorum]TCS38200.1 hypothetical protein BCF53_1168 [Reinekea marinisedimentorum]
MKLQQGDTVVVGGAAFVAKKLARSDNHVAEGVYLGNQTHLASGQKLPKEIPVLIFCSSVSETLSVKAHTPIGNWLVDEVPYADVVLVENDYLRTA